jgi:hypothetical protein
MYSNNIAGSMGHGAGKNISKKIAWSTEHGAWENVSNVFKEA